LWNYFLKNKKKFELEVSATELINIQNHRHKANARDRGFVLAGVSARERGHEIIQFLRGSEECGSTIQSSTTKKKSV
jgi:hypothetical protein